MATQGKAKKEKKKPVPVKTSLNSPYDLRWTPLEKGQKALIIQALKEKIDALGLCKKRAFRRKGKAENGDSGAAEEQRVSRQPGWSDEAARRQLAIGINEVTKGLERNELSLVLVCSSAKPGHMSSHLIPLSKTRGVPACQVPELSESLSGLLGLSSVLALGFRRGAQDFADTVGQIADNVPPLHVAWVPTERRVNRLEDAGEELVSQGAATDEPVGDSLSNPVQTGDGPSAPAAGLKRKRDLSLEAEGETGLLLQPLKVKKTIPNPSKIRKPKKKNAKQK